MSISFVSIETNKRHRLLLLIFIFVNTLALLAQPALGGVHSVSPVIPVPYSTIDPARIQKPEQEPTPKKLPEEITSKSREKPTKYNNEEINATHFKLSSIIIKGVTVYKNGELNKYYKSYLGKYISLADLQNISDAITTHYRNDGYTLARAAIPVQQVASGKVYIQVLEGYIATVSIEGDEKNSENTKIYSKVKEYAEQIKKIHPLQIKTFERYVLLLNDIPGVTIKTLLSPSISVVGAADLIIIIKHKKISGEIYYDNRGSKYTGPKEVVLSAAVNDTLLAADNISLQSIDTPTNKELRYGRLGYSFPVGLDGLYINIDGNLAETRPDFTLQSLGLIGRDKNWDIGIKYPLLRTRTNNIWLYGKFEWVDTYSHYSTTNIFQDHIRSLRFKIAYDDIDRWSGSNSIDLELSKGLHMFGASPPNPQTSLSRTLGMSNYKKILMNISRYQAFGSKFILLAAISGQYSFNNILLSAEEFSFGGIQFGRAYDSSEIVGDKGINGKLELRYNTYPNWSYLQQIQYYAFYEVGAVWALDAAINSSQSPKNSAADTGCGLRATFSEHFYGGLELDKPLTKPVNTQETAGENGKAWRFFFNLGARL